MPNSQFHLEAELVENASENVVNRPPHRSRKIRRPAAMARRAPDARFLDGDDFQRFTTLGQAESGVGLAVGRPIIRRVRDFKGNAGSCDGEIPIPDHADGIA